MCLCSEMFNIYESPVSKKSKELKWYVFRKKTFFKLIHFKREQKRERETGEETAAMTRVNEKLV